MTEKKTERVTLWLPESLEVDLMRHAAQEDRKLSDFITHILIDYAYGHFRQAADSGNVAMSSDAPR